MKKVFVVMALFCFSAMLNANSYLFVSHEGLPLISVISPNADEKAYEIKLPASADEMKLSPDGKKLYYVNSKANALYRVDMKTFKPEADPIRTGFFPVSIVIIPDGKKAYIANKKGKSISVIDLEKFEVSGEAIQLKSQPVALAITDDGSKVFAALSDRDGVAVIDTASGEAKKTVETGTSPWGITYGAGKIFMTNEGISSVSVIDAKRDALLNEVVSTDSPRGVAYSGGQIYVTVAGGVDIFEVRSYEKPASLSLDYELFDAEESVQGGKRKIYLAAYDAASDSGKIISINPAENEILAEIDVKGKPKYLEALRKWPVLPTPTYTPEPTAEPTVVPTAVPTKAPTAVPTKKPVAKPVPKKKPTPKPEPTQDPLLHSDISGKVMIKDVPITGVTIKALNKHTDKVYTVKTDESGKFLFKALPIGGYTMTVNATYIEEKAITLTVNRGKNEPLIIDVKRRKK